MEKFEGKTSTIGTLLSKQSFFRVPEYQRPFSWDADNFDDLIDDIANASKDQEYFLGTIVLHERKAWQFDIVDGQQRLTSLMILLACLRDLVQDQEYKRGIQEKILQPRNVVDNIPEKVRLEVRDRQIFHDLVVSEGGTNQERRPDGLPEPEWRYIKAVDAFRSKLANVSQADLQQTISFISQKCLVIYLATSAFDDAFRLFTIVNDRGKQLRRIDILKALNLAPEVIAKDTIRNRIAQEWEEVERQVGESNFESIFHLVRLILLKDKPQADLLKEFQERVFDKKLIIKGEPFFNLIFEYAKLYAAIFIDRDFVPDGSPSYRKYRALIHIMDAEFQASEWRACLVNFAQKFGPERFHDFCLIVEKVYLAQWVQGVRKDERFAEYAKILNLIEQAKAPEDVFVKIDYDLEVIKRAVARKDIYSVGFGKYLLLRLELVAAEHDVVKEFGAKSVEHVLPQNPEPESRWTEIHNPDAALQYVNSIGNLVLLSKSKNSSASNFEFDKKKEHYLRPRVSDYPRSIQVLNYDEWTKEIIEARTHEAQEMILQDP